MIKDPKSRLFVMKAAIVGSLATFFVTLWVSYARLVEAKRIMAEPVVLTVVVALIPVLCVVQYRKTRDKLR